MSANAPTTTVAGRHGVDPITLDLVENALGNLRREMDAVLFRTAMSPVIREQHDAFPMICDATGRMIVGQFGSYIADLMAKYDGTIEPGDVLLTSDPYMVGGTISHVNDWLVLVPIFFDGELVGWASMFGHQMDTGGPLPGSLPTTAKTIFGEGLRIPPVKIFRGGTLNDEILAMVLSNVRVPDMNRADLMALIAACQVGERGIQGLCARFGRDTYTAACGALLERTYRAMEKLIVRNIPEEPQSFEDWVDDDGCGNGPFRMRLTIWREGTNAYFDWSGTAPQAEGPINFYVNEGMFKMFIAGFLIQVFDPQIMFNDGFYPLLKIVIPKGSLLSPREPAPLGCRTHTLSRLLDVLAGALAQRSPELSTAAGYGSSPYMIYSGWDRGGDFFNVMEISYGGVAGRPVGDGMDGHSVWPEFENIPAEYLESYYPIRVESYSSVPDSGGPGLHRGGNGIEKVYTYLEPGSVSIHDDRWLTSPWGISGGRPGGRSRKTLLRGDGTTQRLPAKCDEVRVAPGDRIVYRTAGGGGWGDPLRRDPAVVATDVANGLVTREGARHGYGVVLDEAGAVETVETDRLRATKAEQRERDGGIAMFDTGPAIDVRLRDAEAETGLPAPATPLQLSWSPLEAPDAALVRVRAEEG
jgi:N-methylhydantoinase B